MTNRTKKPAWIPRKAEVILILFVANIIVILEGRYHTFAALDELVLSLARAAGLYEYSRLNLVNPPSSDLSCDPHQGKYVVLSVTASPSPASPGDEGGAAGGPASNPEGAPLWLATVHAVKSMAPAVLAFDQDPTLSRRSVTEVTGIDENGVAESLSSQTALALIAIPISGSDAQSVSRREQRNAWLRAACKSDRVAIASPEVHPSKHSGAVLQFYGERTRDVALPAAYPSLGQVAHQLDAGLAPKHLGRGPGLICDFLKKSAGAARIPFIDTPHTLAEKSDMLFLGQMSAPSFYSVEWINPYAADQDIRLLSIRNKDDLGALQHYGKACIADRVVFIGREVADSQKDEYRTLAGERTPGVFVHAMVARSAERYLKSALSMNAVIDLLVGYAITYFARRTSLFRTLASDSFSLRLLGNLGKVLSPFLILAFVIVLALTILRIGFLLNPLVVAFGMWLHKILEAILEHASGRKDEAEKGAADAKAAHEDSEAKGLQSAWRAIVRWFPVPAMSQRRVWKHVDRFMYGGSLCVVVATWIYALQLVVSRIRLTFS